MPAEIPTIPIPAVLLAITLCGATVLFLLDVWLRRKGVNDPTLIWLTISLLSWSASAAAQFIPNVWLANNIGITQRQIPYFFSPVSSILFTVTAFRLSRVRELFRRTELRNWPSGIISAVCLLSLSGLLFNLLGKQTAGKTLDASASGIALTVLGVGLIYSFYKYGNQLLAALTAVVFTFYIARQFLEAAHGPPEGALAVLQIAAIITLVFLLIALTVAWGLSATSRLRIVGAPAHVTVIAMFFDLRGSSAWTHHVIRNDLNYAGTFIDHLRAWAWEKSMTFLKERPNLVKFLGDGFLFVWECPQNSREINVRARAVIDLAYSLHEDYPGWCSANSALWRTTPSGLGIGVDAGSAIRITFENGSEDYIGEPINDAANLQEQARPSGGVLIKQEVGDRWGDDSDFLKKFPILGLIGTSPGEFQRVRATGEVDIRSEVGYADTKVTRNP